MLLFRFCLLALLLLSFHLAQADELTIGVRTAAPFVIETENGYEGITIELWNEIATELGIEYTYEERDIQGLLDGIQDGTLDAAVAALTITADREKISDFTHPFFISGTGIAVPYARPSVWGALGALFSVEFIGVLLLLGLLLAATGLCIWLFERKNNPEEFGGSAAEGIGSGFWWSAVTMTTVGYGDKSPKTFGGRIIGLIWMFGAILLISFFTASIASSLTVSQLETSVRGPADLPHVRVGTLTGSATASYLDHQRIRYTGFDTIEEGLRSVEHHEIDAMVHDAPILQHMIGREFRNRLQVLPKTFNQQYYGIALPSGSALRDPMNLVILNTISSDSWEDIKNRYLGD